MHWSCLSIHLLMDTCIGSAFWQLWIRCSEHWHINVCLRSCSQFLGLYLVMELLDHIVVYVSLCEAQTTFNAALSFYIPPTMHKHSNFSALLINTILGDMDVVSHYGFAINFWLKELLKIWVQLQKVFMSLHVFATTSQVAPRSLYPVPAPFSERPPDPLKDSGTGIKYRCRNSLCTGRICK